MYEIKREPADFIVEEITPDGEVLEIGKQYSFDGKSEGEQTICVLEKSNWDTHQALQQVADRLRVSRKRIGFAGTKDKRAVSTQRISIWNAPAEQVMEVRIKDITLTPLYHSKQRVELGDLWGNRFTIKVYSDKPPREINRIPNFFGVQRFGERRPVTHLVGKRIIQNDIEDAVKTYLAKVFEKESPEAKEARSRLAEGWDYAAALAYFPRNLTFERTMIAHLAENDNDYAGALRKLPKTLKIMFVHAFQSYLFNEFLKQVIDRGLDYETGPLYGYELELDNDLEREVLEREWLSSKDFLVRSMPEMSSKGSRRQLFIDVKDFQVLDKGAGCYTVRFSLPKGCYATVAIDELFK